MRLVLVMPCVMFVAAATDAHSQSSDNKRSCNPAVIDTLPGGALPIYRDCDVDKPARLKNNVQPPYHFPPDTRCVVIEMSLVIDSSGLVVPGTAELIAANEPDYAQQVLASLPKWRYEPAKLNGKPVAQRVVARHVRSDNLARLVAEGSTQRPPQQRSQPCR